MKAFFDSSAWTKLYIREPGTDRVLAMCDEADELAVAVICVPEVMSGVNRLKREGTISAEDCAAIRDMIIRDAADMVLCDLTPVVISRTLRLLESHPLRAMDALHLACALEWRADVLVSADARQISAARTTGLRVQSV